MSKANIYLKAMQIKSAVKLASARGIDSGGKVQKFIDSEVLRKSEPYVPKLTRTLIKSGTIHTEIGSGKVIYRTPYARRQYYENAGNGKEGTSKGGRRGKMWFERMKANHREEILSGAAKGAVNYSINIEPTNPVIKQYTDGSSLKALNFTFHSHEHYSSSEADNSRNLKFYNEIEKWIKENNHKNIVPDLTEFNKYSQEVEILTSGYLFENDEDTGQYVIQLRLIYMEEY